MNQKYDDVWKNLGKKKLLETPFVTVYEELLQKIGGQEATYYIVNRKNFVGIVPIWDDGTTLLVGEWRHGVKDFCWGFSMGYIEEGEAPIDGAKREFHEETGYSQGEYHFLGKTVASPSYNGSTQFTFVAVNPQKHSDKTDGEVEEFKRLPFKDVEQLIVDGEIYDNNTITAYFLAKHFLSYSHPEGQ